MPSYPFEDVEQQAIRDLGSNGFRLSHETKKALLFENDVTGHRVYVDREGEPHRRKVAFVVPMRSAAGFESISGVGGTRSKHSSNFRAFEKSITRSGLLQHGGLKIILEDASASESVIQEIKRVAP
jgi:hypothetical protein